MYDLNDVSWAQWRIFLSHSCIHLLIALLVYLCPSKHFRFLSHCEKKANCGSNNTRVGSKFFSFTSSILTWYWEICMFKQFRFVSISIVFYLFWIECIGKLIIKTVLIVIFFLIIIPLELDRYCLQNLLFLFFKYIYCVCVCPCVSYWWY